MDFDGILTDLYYFRLRKWTFHDECAFGAHILLDFILGNIEKIKENIKNAMSNPQNFLGAFGAE